MLIFLRNPRKIGPTLICWKCFDNPKLQNWKIDNLKVNIYCYCDNTILHRYLHPKTFAKLTLSLLWSPQTLSDSDPVRITALERKSRSKSKLKPEMILKLFEEKKQFHLISSETKSLFAKILIVCSLSSRVFVCRGALITFYSANHPNVAKKRFWRTR